ncbi:RNA polymerase sigma-70 factor, ECF subfamily [Candidatus Paraburkholderia calva]|nr:RNA polymerase sigma-70 factor, ECF subfamily [Candidatus Paraburkholderia calva]
MQADFRESPVRNLKRHDFFKALGLNFDPAFTNDDAGFLVIGENIFAMLLVEKFFQTSTEKPLVDTHRATEALVCLSCESRAEMDNFVARVVRDVVLAEELAQDTVVAALEHWSAAGVPEKPGAWLMTTAKNKALDRLRQHALHTRKHEELGRDMNAQELHVTRISSTRSTQPAKTISAMICCG